MSRESWLPKGGENLFQKIKQWCTEAEAGGQELIRLSIGQPTGPALQSAREEAARLILAQEQQVHEYQDNTCLPCPDFAQRFVQAHVPSDLGGPTKNGDISFLPIPGIKPMLGLIPLACAARPTLNHFPVKTATNPGYPTPAVWADLYLGCDVEPCLGETFLPEMPPFKKFSGLYMLNYPHNPSGQALTRDEWVTICEHCASSGSRLFNDAAYAILTHDKSICMLTEVAIEYSTLSWCEAFSASKAGNFTGWRVGALAGSPDFIGDIATIKGNTDSGFNAALAMGVLHAFENDRKSIDDVRTKYGERIELLIEVLTEEGMGLAVYPKAGFFTLWEVPHCAFGQDVADAEHFNRLMIEKTGVVGVHFHPYIRYAVVGPVESQIAQIRSAFREAKVSY